MPNPAFETVDPPYSAFSFEVVLNLDNPPPGVSNPICDAAFAECDGLEMTMEPKTFRQGGDSARQVHLMGPVSYSQLTLRRGMTNNLQLWAWFLAATQPGQVMTAQGEVTLWDADGTPRVTFVLADCLPVKMRGPALHAQTGQVAIEELQLVFGSLTVRPAGGDSFGVNASLGLSAGLSVSGGFSASLGGGASVSGGPGLSASADVSASASFSLG